MLIPLTPDARLDDPALKHITPKALSDLSC